jgi:hypothetical protein
MIEWARPARLKSYWQMKSADHAVARARQLYPQARHPHFRHLWNLTLIQYLELREQGCGDLLAARFFLPPFPRPEPAGVELAGVPENRGLSNPGPSHTATPLGELGRSLTDAATGLSESSLYPEEKE